MKILWIADMSSDIHLGGAQRTDRMLLDYAATHDIEVTELNYYNSKVDVTPTTHSEYDYIITGNVYMFSKVPGFLDWIETLKNHIRFEHDANSYMSQQQRTRLFGNTLLTVFLSQEHQEYFSETYGKLFTSLNTKWNNPCIDTSLFYNKNRPDRTDGTVWAGLLHPLKGLDILKQRARSGEQIAIAAVGNEILIKDILALPNVTFLGRVMYEHMPHVFNAHKRLLYRPGQLEPFCRTVGEAILCGMEIDTANSQYKIGALELLNRIGLDKFTELCSNAAKRFWELVADVQR